MKPNYRLLNKMAKFLRELPPKMFDFSDYVVEHDTMCGTVCCAIGWLPKIEPSNFKWVYRPTCDNMLEVTCRGDKAGDVLAKLGVSMDEYDYLFLPGSSCLGRKSTAIEVASNIELFVKAREKVDDDELDSWDRYLISLAGVGIVSFESFKRYKERHA